jgi:hypothetical protein
MTLGITQFAGLETRDTADLEVCATVAVPGCAQTGPAAKKDNCHKNQKDVTICRRLRLPKCNAV